MTQPDVSTLQGELFKTGSGPTTLLPWQRSARLNFRMHRTLTRWEKLTLNKLPDYLYKYWLASHSKVCHNSRLCSRWPASHSKVSHFYKLGISFKRLSLFLTWHLIQKSLTFTELASHSKFSLLHNWHLIQTSLTLPDCLQVDWHLIQTSVTLRDYLHSQLVYVQDELHIENIQL